MRTTNPLEERVLALIEPDAQALGYRLVRLRLSGLRRKRLQVMAERLSDGQMEVDDCARLSRAISALLDESDPISGEYDLEVSSPGIDRPLMRIEDFARFVGHEAKLETTAMIDGRKRFKGAIAGVEGDVIRLSAQDGEVRLRFADLHDARLLLTDKLIEEDLRRAKRAQGETRAFLPPLAGEVPSEARGRGESDASPSASRSALATSPVNGGGKAHPGRQAKHTKRKDT